MTDHERALLGCALTDVAAARDLLRTIEPYMFVAAAEQTHLGGAAPRAGGRHRPRRPG